MAKPPQKYGKKTLKFGENNEFCQKLKRILPRNKEFGAQLRGWLTRRP
jgi:hypothetical protein